MLFKSNPRAKRLVFTLFAVALLGSLIIFLLGSLLDIHLLGRWRETILLLGMLGASAIYIAMLDKKMTWQTYTLFTLGLGTELLLFLPWESLWRLKLLMLTAGGILIMLVMSSFSKKS